MKNYLIRLGMLMAIAIALNMFIQPLALQAQVGSTLTKEKIQAALGPRILGSRPYSLTRVGKCHDAVMAASRLAQPGFVVLFSPGGTSFAVFSPVPRQV